jgi:endonuclease/exonuclease/phosphatase family metal-dependent hydrolase
MGKWLLGLLGLSTISYVSSFISPEVFWPAIFFSFSIPFFIALNVILLFFLLLKRSRWLLIPLAGLLISTPFILRTVGLHPNPQKQKEAISVLSFNAKFFRKAGIYNQFSSQMIDWVVNDSSMIKCIQEYSTNANWPGLDVTGKLEQNGYKGFTVKSTMRDNDHSNGLGIFSQYKIIDTGIVLEPDTTANGIIYVDLAIGRDTLRVYNAHLESMNLVSGEIVGFFSKLKQGSIRRSLQVKMLIDHTKTSPYPFVVCGDFNETPYSYSYSSLRSAFSNSFEKAGRGFGFTLNSSLFFLRIDHQFYGNNIAIQNYHVDRSMNVSDHFPTFGFYTIE